MLGLLERAEERCIPLSAVLELTHECNLRCPMCYLGPRRDARHNLSAQQWLHVLEELAAEGCLLLALTGGEPLLQPDFFEIATAARALGFAIRILTNGTLVHESVADRIAALLPLGVEVSLHGTTGQTHAAMVGGIDCRKSVVAAVRRLRERGIPVRLKCVVTRINAAELDALAALGERLGAQVSFDPEVTPRNDGDDSPTSTELEESELVRHANRIWPELAHAGRIDRRERLNQAPCAAGRRVVHVGPSGLVFPCTQWTEPAGDLRRESFRSVWREAPMLREIRAIKVRDLRDCPTCAHLPLCSPCMALGLLEAGRPSAPSRIKCRTASARATASLQIAQCGTCST